MSQDPRASRQADDASRLIEGAIERRVFPSAVAEAGSSARVIWRAPFGRLTFDQDAANTTETTIFDLASLTKAMATATLAIDLMRSGRLRLDERIATAFAEWRGWDRESTTVRDFLEHASGLPARLVDRPPQTRREFEHEICTIRLEYTLRTQSIYSDLDFILLAFLLEQRAGRALDAQFDDLWRPLAGEADSEDWIGFHVAPADRPRTAPTKPLEEDARVGRVLVGEVHDAYAAALGGVAGHAGLFGTAPAVGRFARAMLRGARGDASMRGPFSPDAVALAVKKTSVPRSSRALGWDTMLPTSSCGTTLSPAAFGHVGFTGTSLWIDPTLDRYFVLLTNRAYSEKGREVFPTSSMEKPPDPFLDHMRTVRRSFHDILSSIDG